MWKQVQHLLEMIRFSHTLFALPFAMLSAVMAWTTPAPADLATPVSLGFRWEHLVGILICMVGARSAAMAFNRLVDQKFDAQNPRTKMRHLPAGLLSQASVVFFTLLMSAIFVAGTLLFLPNRLPIYLSLPVLAILLAYSYTKRFTSLAHFWLGMSLMLAPISAWIALRGEVLLQKPQDILPALMLGLSVLAWVSGFDIIYACQDADYDRSAKLRSVPAWLGVPGALRLAAFCHFVTMILLGLLPVVCPQVRLAWVYGVAVALVAILLIYEHWLVKPNDLSRVNVAFFNINVIISVGLFIAASIDLLRASFGV